MEGDIAMETIHPIEKKLLSFQAVCFVWKFLLLYLEFLCTHKMILFTDFEDLTIPTFLSQVG